MPGLSPALGFPPVIVPEIEHQKTLICQHLVNISFPVTDNYQSGRNLNHYSTLPLLY